MPFHIKTIEIDWVTRYNGIKSEGDGQMTKDKTTIKKQLLPLLPLKGLNIFPSMNIHFDVGRAKSINALEEAMGNNQMIFLVAQKDAKNNSPQKNDIYRVGTISKINQLLKLPGDIVRVSVEGLSRANICEITQTDPFFMVEVSETMYEGAGENDIEVEALIRNVHSIFEKYSKLSGKISPEVVMSIMANEDINELSDRIVSNIYLKFNQKQKLLSDFDPKHRLEELFKILVREVDILKVEKNINVKVREKINKMQKEYYLREQLKVIQNELGDKDGIAAEIKEYQNRLKKRNLPEEAKQKVMKELNRLKKIPQGSAEGSVVRTYLDWIFDLPWDKKTNESIDLDRSERILEEDHYGLEKVKQRVLEYLAICKLKKGPKGPILCLIGPPGVGKTSVAKSVARALNRKYVRMSLGGVRDEAEIRGHRRTYVGAMPGRIISALKRAGTKNPLILMDEIDKMSSDFKGDPASALLEVLDTEQNYYFKDHYLELPFDLSDVMFLTTANNYETIPGPLLDRMEVIYLTSYTEEEKVNIGMKYLLQKQLKEHGLKKSNIRIRESVIRDIVNYYTREAGVRSLERKLGKMCRKIAKKLISSGQKSVTVSLKNLESIMGKREYSYNKADKGDQTGVATGLAWTPAGGDTLSIEVNTLEGIGKLELTGCLGDIMKESVKTAIGFIRSKTVQYGIESDFYNKYDIHVHVPQGAVPKEGPSAGITLTTALISALTGCPVRHDVAMTGEITLRGRVLKVGGIKEKVLAAHRAGFKTVIIPAENEKDLEEISENVKDKIQFVLADYMHTVLNNALIKQRVDMFNKDQDLFGQEDKIIIPDAQPVINDIGQNTELY